MPRLPARSRVRAAKNYRERSRHHRVTVLADLSGVHAGAIKSSAFDLGRPLVVIGDTIQFFDEPAETWFRERFKPSREAFDEFLRRLAPLAMGNAYVASVLPHLLLEAGHFDQLVALALSSDSLPQENPLERRDVELQRLQFALKASLRARRYTDATKLAMKAGGETAGDQRQQKLLQEHTDLASSLMDGEKAKSDEIRIPKIRVLQQFAHLHHDVHHALLGKYWLIEDRPQLSNNLVSHLWEL
jgi:hypothetical protein